jgi:hypothetical protein
LSTPSRVTYTNLPYTWMNVTHTHTHTTNALPHSTKLCCKLWIDHSHACHTHMPLTCTTYTHKYAHVHECRTVDQKFTYVHALTQHSKQQMHTCAVPWKRLRQHTYIFTVEYMQTLSLHTPIYCMHPYHTHLLHLTASHVSDCTPAF